MSENQLVPQDLVGGSLAKSFDSVVAGADYLPRFQLFGSKSDACTEGRIGIGHYGLVKDTEITDVGAELNVVFVSWRPKAVQTGGENLIIVYDVDDPIFQEIKTKSGQQNSGAMYGPEFLIWVPDAGTLATYHMNSKTARREAKKLEPLMGRAVTMKCRLIDPPNSKFKWHGPVVLPCSTPLDPPPEELMRAEHAKFQNPPKMGVELAQDEAEGRAR